jgi:hypothetical protein
MLNEPTSALDSAAEPLMKCRPLPTTVSSQWCNTLSSYAQSMWQRLRRKFPFAVWRLRPLEESRTKPLASALYGKGRVTPSANRCQSGFLKWGTKENGFKICAVHANICVVHTIKNVLDCHVLFVPKGFVKCQDVLPEFHA